MKENKGFWIVILGRYSLMREGVSRVLEAEGFRVQVSEPGAGHLRIRTRAPRLLFLIVHSGDDFSGVVAEIELVKQHYPEANVAVVAEHYGLNEPSLAFEAGAVGYLVNAVSCNAFVKSIELLMLGEAIFPPSFHSPALTLKIPRRARADAAFVQEDERPSAGMSHESEAVPALSPRETAILRCLIEGDSNKFIARKIEITEATVKAHVKAILRKIRVQNRTQAAIWGMNHAPFLPANSNSLFRSANEENA